ncbi:glycosyltransferase family 1 protein [Nemorincola caseinilytica]|uniref:Glycosyltransferase family 1 protein n=1 Tax=Nemorincola caseinilytica TaxID=2054315 RepID=A0ABP8NB73_9BACT
MINNRELTVTHYYREPRNTGVSIEGIFRTVKQDLEGRAAIRDHVCDPKQSRVKNTLEAAKYASDINHITGDVNFLALGLRGHRNILTIHDLGYYENPVHSRLKHLIYHTFWFALPLRYIDVVTVVSEFTRNKLLQYFKYPEHKIRVIADPVKPAFRYMHKDQLHSKPVVLMLGTGKHKNLDNLIEAARDMNVHLDIVGWPAQDELDRLKGYGISHTIYNRLTDEEVYQRYLNCDILFIASHYEGFGMPIIEAQAVGRPVITSNIGAMLEVGKGSAVLVDPKDPRQIRDELVALAKDRMYYGDVVKRGLKNAARFDHRVISEQYLELYKEIYRDMRTRGK